MGGHIHLVIKDSHLRQLKETRKIERSKIVFFCEAPGYTMEEL